MTTRAPCPTCSGTGQVEGERAEWIRIGELMRLDREARGVSLEDEGRERVIPMWALAQMEQGWLRPVPREMLI